MEKEPQAPYDNGKLVSTYEMITKDNEGEAHRHILHKYEYDTTQDTERRFLSQADPTIINIPEVHHRRSKDVLTIPFNDMHFGFRRECGELIPTHDPEALDKMLQLCEAVQPNNIVINGDGIDLPELSTFAPDSKAMVETTQASLNGLHAYLSMLRAVCPNAKIVYLEGNHDRRSEKTLLKNALPLFGIKPANMPTQYPVTSIPFLLRLDELEIEYRSGYPANSFDVNNELKIMHGEFASNNTAQKYLGLYACSICFGHTHRAEMLKFRTPDGQLKTAFNPGTLCRIDGAIPSVHNGVDVHGKFVTRYENWHQGASVIESTKDNFRFDLIDLEQEKVKYQKRIYQARDDICRILSEAK